MMKLETTDSHAEDKFQKKLEQYIIFHVQSQSPHSVKFNV